MKHIVCFHLYNDYSGSPKVLRMVLEGMLKRGYKVDLVTSRGGVLDELKGTEGLRMHQYSYAFSDSGAVTMLRYAWVQVYTFFLALRWAFRKDCTFYINTLLPIAPALAGRLTGKRVVYHYHENASVKGAFYKALAWLMQRLAHRIICVSEYQASFLRRKDKVKVVPNALSREFVAKLHPDAEAAFERKNVLMLSSLKEYKGTREFVELARQLPQFKFTLVINDSQENVDKFMTTITPPPEKYKNLIVYARQSKVYEFYNSASLVVNLTNPRQAIETFGLTAIEAMSAGLPVIVPPVGGIAEMVDNGVNGYKIDVQKLSSIARHITSIFDNRTAYLSLSMAASSTAARFKEDAMISDIIDTVRL